MFCITQIHLEEGPGDVLVFLTGQEEIESVERLIQERLRQLPEDNRNMWTVSIFSSLPSEKQMRVFAPTHPGFRKVNIQAAQFFAIFICAVLLLKSDPFL